MRLLRFYFVAWIHTHTSDLSVGAVDRRNGPTSLTYVLLPRQAWGHAMRPFYLFADSSFLMKSSRSDSENLV